MNKNTSLFSLLITFIKIGLFTFGGGYAMIPLIQKEIVNKRKWLTDNELMEVLIIAESTPGPISINLATYVGYKVKGIWGSIISTIAIALPSFVIIFIISLFFKDFLKIKWVQSAFKGIQAAVAVLIISAGYKLFKDAPKSIFNLITIITIIALCISLKFFNVQFSSIWFILIGAVIGFIFYLIDRHKEKLNPKITIENDNVKEDENK